MSGNLDQVLSVADAVLCEGYLLYPYRADSRKNQVRWQFGVLGPADAERAGIGEDSCARPPSFWCAATGARRSSPGPVPAAAAARTARTPADDGSFEPVDQLTVADQSWLSWDEAVEHQITFGPSISPIWRRRGRFRAWCSRAPTSRMSAVAGSFAASRQLHGEFTIAVEADARPGPAHDDGTQLCRTGAGQRRCDRGVADRPHLIAEVTDGDFVSLLEPDESAVAAVSRCSRHRCFPVLAGPPGTHDTMLVSPIILYDYPEIAEQSQGDLFDSCEIDEILTLRVADDDRRGESRRPGHRSPGRRDHRPL